MLTLSQTDIAVCGGTQRNPAGLWMLPLNTCSAGHLQNQQLSQPESLRARHAGRIPTFGRMSCSDASEMATNVNPPAAQVVAHGKEWFSVDEWVVTTREKAGDKDGKDAALLEEDDGQYSDVEAGDHPPRVRPPPSLSRVRGARRLALVWMGPVQSPGTGFAAISPRHSLLCLA